MTEAITKTLESPKIDISKEILVIPDIHGRIFWKDATKFDGEIIFLGDYVDPYPHEFKDQDINKVQENTLVNFEEILEFAKSNNKVHLLIGNHDYSYFKNIPCCRHDYIRDKEFHNLFTDNKELFSVIYLIDNLLLSHAGIHKEWMNFNKISNIKEIDIDNEGSLWQPDYMRGGDFFSGSPLWADARTFPDKDIEYYQIFGHTQLKGPYIQETWACLDCHKMFKVSKNNIEEWKI